MMPSLKFKETWRRSKKSQYGLRTFVELNGIMSFSLELEPQTKDGKVYVHVQSEWKKRPFFIPKKALGDISSQIAVAHKVLFNDE